MQTKVVSQYINKNGFYIVDENSPSAIDIAEGIYVMICMVDTKKPFTFHLEEWAKLDFYGFFCETSPQKLVFNQLQPSSKLQVKTMFFCDKNSLKSQIKSYIASDKSTSNVMITNMISENHLFVDSSIEVEEQTHGVVAHLQQKNIFIGQNGTMRGFPTLYVKSDDLEASHSCQVERLNEDHLFYLKSRWLSHELSTHRLVESYFIHTFWCLSMVEKDFYEMLYKKFLTQ